MSRSNDFSLPMQTAFAKRMFDILTSGAALVVALPMMALVALVVRLDTPGPILFRQVRVGRRGDLFHILKFRTMADRPATPGHEITLHRDPRVTRSGVFLRRWKADELPQLWNVLRGDMSIVGPRPEVPKYVALYPEHERAIVLAIRPGITDPASIKYRSEADMLASAVDPEQMYREVILPDKLALAVDYAQAVSLRRDMVIIAQTLLKVAR
jgi:lipopolysaccharide/colanic/teichoic acid biosynthesis glycosyltransferase